MTDKDPKQGFLENIPSDNLNAEVGVLTRREIEARILAPVIHALSRQFGNTKVLNTVRDTIIQIAARQGVELAGQMGGRCSIGGGMAHLR